MDKDSEYGGIGGGKAMNAKEEAEHLARKAKAREEAERKAAKPGDNKAMKPGEDK